MGGREVEEREERTLEQEGKGGNIMSSDLNTAKGEQRRRMGRT